MHGHIVAMLLRFDTDTATTEFAQRIAPLLRAGDTLLLSGSIGAGKSHFARGVIRTLFGETTEVPSPTFTLVQTYGQDPEVWHADLYRLSSVDEAIELGLEDAFEQAICLIEWPDRLGELTPKDALQIAFSAGEGGHEARITMPANWSARLADLDLREFYL